MFAVDERVRSKRLAVRIRERHGVKAESLERFRKSFIIHQSTHGDAGRCRNPKPSSGCNSLHHASPQTLEAPVELVLGHAVTVDRNEQALEAGGRECLYMVGEEPAVGDQPAFDTALGCRLDQRHNLWMNERLTALECHVANAAPAHDRYSPREPGEINVAAWTREVLVACETAEIARGIA